MRDCAAQGTSNKRQEDVSAFGISSIGDGHKDGRQVYARVYSVSSRSEIKDWTSRGKAQRDNSNDLKRDVDRRASNRNDAAEAVVVAAYGLLSAAGGPGSNGADGAASDADLSAGRWKGNTQQLQEHGHDVAVTTLDRVTALSRTGVARAGAGRGRGRRAALGAKGGCAASLGRKRRQATRKPVCVGLSVDGG